MIAFTMRLAGLAPACGKTWWPPRTTHADGVTSATSRGAVASLASDSPRSAYMQPAPVHEQDTGTSQVCVHDDDAAGHVTAQPCVQVPLVTAPVPAVIMQDPLGQP